jgi:hypothetical protein
MKLLGWEQLLLQLTCSAFCSLKMEGYSYYLIHRSLPNFLWTILVMYFRLIWLKKMDMKISNCNCSWEKSSGLFKLSAMIWFSVLNAGYPNYITWRKSYINTVTKMNQCLIWLFWTYALRCKTKYKQPYLNGWVLDSWVFNAAVFQFNRVSPNT